MERQPARASFFQFCMCVVVHPQVSAKRAAVGQQLCFFWCLRDVCLFGKQLRKDLPFVIGSSFLDGILPFWMFGFDLYFDQRLGLTWKVSMDRSLQNSLKRSFGFDFLLQSPYQREGAGNLIPPVVIARIGPIESGSCKFSENREKPVAFRCFVAKSFGFLA